MMSLLLLTWKCQWSRRLSLRNADSKAVEDATRQTDFVVVQNGAPGMPKFSARFPGVACPQIPIPPHTCRNDARTIIPLNYGCTSKLALPGASASFIGVR